MINKRRRNKYAGEEKWIGYGLDSLIPNKKNDISDSKVEKKQEKENDSPKSGEIMVRINEVELNRDQLRKILMKMHLWNLQILSGNSVFYSHFLCKKEKYKIGSGKEDGVLQNLQESKKFDYCKDYTDRKTVEISLIENIQRENLNPIEEAMAFKRLLQEFQL